MKVLNKRTDGIPPDAIYVGRPSKWGNPFKVGIKYHNRRIDQFDAVSLHKDWLLNSDIGTQLLEDVSELKGKDLVCWCTPLPCHANILLELANEMKK